MPVDFLTEEQRQRYGLCKMNRRDCSDLNKCQENRYNYQESLKKIVEMLKKMRIVVNIAQIPCGNL